MWRFVLKSLGLCTHALTHALIYFLHFSPEYKAFRLVFVPPAAAAATITINFEITVIFPCRDRKRRKCAFVVVRKHTANDDRSGKRGPLRRARFNFDIFRKGKKSARD